MTQLEPAPCSFLERLRAMTPARVGTGVVGSSLPTQSLLEFQLAAARAKDAIYTDLDAAGIRAELGGEVVEVHSKASTRSQYLANPDLGRRLRSDDAEKLRPGRYDLAIVLADGLSATAVRRHGPALVRELTAGLATWRVPPVVVARQSRVALGDEIGAGLGADLVVVLIGERPGLMSPDSLSAYITFDPRVGRTDAERNCVSNIRPPEGLSYTSAARRILSLMQTMRRFKLSGVSLPDVEFEADPPSLDGPQP